MGSADGFVRDGWHEKAVVDAEKTGVMILRGRR